MGLSLSHSESATVFLLLVCPPAISRFYLFPTLLPKSKMSANLLSFTRHAHVRLLQPLSITSKRFYKLSVGSVKKGQIVQLKDKAWKVLTRDHVSTGRGGAVVKVTQPLNHISIEISNI